MADSTFHSPLDKCRYRITCPGYLPGLCVTQNCLDNDEWCMLHKEERERIHCEPSQNKITKN